MSEAATPLAKTGSIYDDEPHSALAPWQMLVARWSGQSVLQTYLAVHIAVPQYLP